MQLLGSSSQGVEGGPSSQSVQSYRQPLPEIDVAEDLLQVKETYKLVARTPNYSAEILSVVNILF
jgi:hypothetical protein